jgi:glycosyltransferase involved in cell wall biosynthesis
MTILILARGIPSENDPQEGCFEWDQAKALKSIGINPIVMALDARRRKGHHKWGITHLWRDEIEFYQIYGGTTTIIEHLISYKIATIINVWLIEKLFLRVLKDHPEINLIHAHYLRCINRASIIGKKYNIPVVGTEHWSKLVSEKLDSNVFALGQNSYPQIDKLICVSDYLKNSIKQRFNVDSIVCGNVLSFEFINAKIAEIHKQKNDYFKFISCGSLIHRKGYDLIIKSAAKMSIPKDKWKLEIIGEGNLKKELLSLVTEYGLQENIIFRGHLNKREIVKALNSSDTFILGSRSETFGVVVIEALSMGVPVICTRCGGTDGLIDDSNGQYIPTDDIEAMIKAMEYAYNNQNHYNRIMIRENCLKKYSPKAIANQLSNIYNKVIQNTNK